MNTVMVIAAREIRERSRLFIVGAALALVPFAAALVPAASSQRGLAIMTVGLTLSVAYGVTLALGIGATTVGRELTDKRLSFYFSKPISPLALWIGKSVASLLVTGTCLAIVITPSIVLAFGTWRSMWIANNGPLVLLPLFGLFVVFFASHVVATMVRSRSVLIAFDFVLALLTFVVLALIVRPVLLGSVWDKWSSWDDAKVLYGLLAVFGVALFVVLAIAPVWQLAKGRTDARRSHAALSRFLWSGVAVLLLATASFVFWLRAATPSTLVGRFYIDQAPRGGWAVVAGVGEHRGDFASSFLLNTATGEFSRLEPGTGGAYWSRNGRLVAWTQPASLIPNGVVELYTRRVGSDQSQATGIVSKSWGPFVLSDDGSRAALITEGIVAVYDLRAHRLLASARVSNRFFARRMFFVTPDVLRVIQRQDLPNHVLDWSVIELDVRTRKLARYSRLTEAPQSKTAWPSERVTVSEDGSRMFLHGRGEIVDGRTLAPIAMIGPPSSALGAAMLNDGSVVLVDRTNGAHLRIFDRSGQLLHEVELPNMRNAIVTSETSDGKVIVDAWPRPFPDSGEPSRFMIDWARGTIDSVSHMRGPIYWWSTDPRTLRFEAGRPFVGVDDAGKLKIWSTKS